MKRLAILGAGGHGKVAAEIARFHGWESIDFFDERWPSTNKNGIWDVVGDEELLKKDILQFDGFFIAIGNNSIRKEKQKMLSKLSTQLVTLVAKSAVISSSVTLGCGVLVAEGVCINIDTHIGDGVIINTGATVDHDCHIKSFAHICPGVNLAGEVLVGNESMLGIGTSVIQCINIGDRVTVGAGSVVISDINDGQTVVGVPAKITNRE